MQLVGNCPRAREGLGDIPGNNICNESRRYCFVFLHGARIKKEIWLAHDWSMFSCTDRVYRKTSQFFMLVPLAKLPKWKFRNDYSDYWRIPSAFPDSSTSRLEPLWRQIPLWLLCRDRHARHLFGGCLALRTALSLRSHRPCIAQVILPLSSPLPWVSSPVGGGQYWKFMETRKSLDRHFALASRPLTEKQYTNRAQGKPLCDNNNGIQLPSDRGSD